MTLPASSSPTHLIVQSSCNNEGTNRPRDKHTGPVAKFSGLQTVDQDERDSNKALKNDW